MWNEPYLETCCRSALHRLTLAGTVGRPTGLRDAPCLERLETLNMVCMGEDGRYRLTADGVRRHASEVMKRRPGHARVPA